MDPLNHRQRRMNTHQESKTDRWSVPDLIDFDYYVDEDERLARESSTERKRIAERDRRLYRDHIQQASAGIPEHSPRHRALALRLWLSARRSGEDPDLRSLLPGAAYARGQRLVSVGLLLLGLVLGIGVASALLSYDGRHPINVSWYVFVLVIMQILLVGTTAGIWYARRSALMQTTVQDISLLGQLVKPLFATAARWVQRQRLAHVPRDVSDRAKARQGLLKSHYALYGPAIYLPMLVPAQLFGIGFNLGAIFITVALEWFTDLAFGWGSALNVEPGTIHTIAQAIALPWSWLFGEGIGIPTLEQVAGTRINLKDPLFFLNADHLRSWRWFLVLAVFTYGLLPRLVLLALSVLKQRRTLAALPFTHQRTQALYARMITPMLETGGNTGSGPAMPIPAPLKPLTTARAAPQADEGASAQRVAEQESKLASDSQPKVQPAAPKPKPAPEPKPEPVPEPAPEPKPEPAPEPTPESASEPEPISVPAHEPMSEMPSAPRSEPSSGLAAKPEREPKQESSVDARSGTPPTGTAIAADACVLLIHVDVADTLEEADHGRLQLMLRQLSGWRVAASATFGGGSTMATQALSLVHNSQWESAPARVALLQDGSQPPITESLRFLRAVRAAAGDQAQILLALVGDPEGDDPLPPLALFDFTDWQSKIEQMGDPYLRLEMLAGSDQETD